MEKVPSPENNKKTEIERLLESYPLPEKLKDKAELALELKEIINSLLEKDRRHNNFENFTKLGNFARNLRNKYKDAANYWTYNMSIGSSYDKEKAPSKFDFPGDDSIEKFLKFQELSSKLDN